MSLTVRSTEIHIHTGSEPNFAIASREHPQGAWVVAQNSTQQQRFFDAAKLARDFHTYVEITFDRYEEADQARRFYWGVTKLVYGTPSAPAHSASLLREREPQVDKTKPGDQQTIECWPALDLSK
jgi:hypothetical protein